MPINQDLIRAFDADDIFRHLSQLLHFPLDATENRHVTMALADPETWRSETGLDTLRTYLLWYSERLHHVSRGGGVSLATDALFILEEMRSISAREWRRLVQGDWSEVIGESARPIRRIETPPNFQHADFPQKNPVVSQIPLEMVDRRKKRKSWECAFEDEQPYEDFQVEDKPPILFDDSGLTTSEKKMSESLSLREVAEQLPPGVLGMHRNGNENLKLIFRPEKEDDPRVRLLKGDGWFEVRNYPQVLFAAPTLENYNILLDTGMEYKQSKNVAQWHWYITEGLGLSPVLVGALNRSPLFDYQRDAVRFLFGRERAMLSLSPGLGKTLTSAFAASLSGFKNILLVCPASLLHYWYGELQKWGPQLVRQPLAQIWHKETGTLPTDLPALTQFWAITNPETVTRYLDEFVYASPGVKNLWDLLILDESIMYKHRDSQRSQRIHALAQGIPNAWLLTGAPATRYLDDLWHQFHILNSQGYASYWRFAKKYCHVEENPWAKTVVANKRDAETEIKENFADVYFARSQEEVADIPDWLMEDVNIPMAPRQEAAYLKLRKELQIFIGDKDDREIIHVNNRLSLVLRSLQIASNPVLVGGHNSSGKWSALGDLMSVYPGPYIVWVNFIRTGEMLLDMVKELRIPLQGTALGHRPMRACLVNGATEMKDRQTMVDDFQAGKYDVLIMNSSVGKFGFTLTKARTAFFVERGYDDSYFQCLFRNRRIGTTQSPVVVNMRSVTQSGNRTIDHVVHDALDYRNQMIRQLTIGDLRGLVDDE